MLLEQKEVFGLLHRICFIDITKGLFLGDDDDVMHHIKVQTFIDIMYFHLFFAHHLRLNSLLGLLLLFSFLIPFKGHLLLLFVELAELLSDSDSVCDGLGFSVPLLVF